MIKFTEVYKKYPNGVLAIDGISVTIEDGEFIYIVGPSGAGKSTFTKLINRAELPNSGQIQVGSFDVVNMKKRKVPYLRRQVGVVYQDFKLLPKKTVYENVAYALEVTETKEKEIKRRTLESLELVGLADKEKMFPNELSGGEQQRVAIARAIVNQPDVIIADEPTGNLDPDMSREIVDVLEDINKRGTTVIMATHDATIVNERPHRVLAIEDGRLVRDEERGDYGYENTKSNPTL